MKVSCAALALTPLPATQRVPGPSEPVEGGMCGVGARIAAVFNRNPYEEFDTHLERQMLLRVVVEETLTERIVVTVYKTSQIAKYLRILP
jgi:hypothetical protein